MELIVATISGIILFVGGIIFGIYDSDPNIVRVGLGLSLAVVVALILGAALWKSNFAQNLFSKLRASFDLLEESRSNLPIWILIFLVSWLTQGISLYLTLLAWKRLPIQSLGIITITYASGWVAGFLFPLAPNGLGIREGILVVGLGSLISAALALTAGLALRIVVVAAETIWAALFWLLSLRN